MTPSLDLLIRDQKILYLVIHFGVIYANDSEFDIGPTKTRYEETT